MDKPVDCKWNNIAEKFGINSQNVALQHSKAANFSYTIWEKYWQCVTFLVYSTPCQSATSLETPKLTWTEKGKKVPCEPVPHPIWEQDK